MNILKRIEKTKKFMLEASEELRKRGKESIIQDALFYTATLDAKIRSWVDGGQKTFILSRDLIEAFQNTDISLDMCPADFHYPFQSFIVEGDVPFFETTTMNEQLQPNDRRMIDTIMYMDSSILLGRNDVLIMDVEGNLDQSVNWQHSITAMFPGSDGGLENIMMYMKGEEPLHTAVDTKKTGSMMLPISPEDARNIANIFFNTILYVNDPSRDVAETQSAGSRKFKLGGKKVVRNEYIYLRAPKSYKSVCRKSGRTLDKRFIVRGHWRNQAFGEKMKCHRRTWIKPYWKGLDMSEVVSKPYVISK